MRRSPEKRNVLGSPPDLQGLDVQTTIRQSADLLQEARSWCRLLEQNKAPPAPKITAAAPVKQPQPPRRVAPVQQKRPEQPPMDLRSDIETLRKEVKHLEKKMAKKAEKIDKKKKKIQSEKKSSKENVPLEISAEQSQPISKSKNYDAVFQQPAPEVEQPRLEVCPMRDVVIRRALTMQTGPKITISPQPVLSRLSNVRFATFEHRTEISTPLKRKEIVAPPEQVAPSAPEPVPVADSGCQTSPPKLVNIFSQTERVVVSVQSVAVQSSPEVRVQRADLQVQTESIRTVTVGVETTRDISVPQNTVEELPSSPEKISTIGPAGDTSSPSAPPAEIPPSTSFSSHHVGNLSPIIEVASSNISPDLVSPLVTPKVQLTIPETSKSDQSAVSPGSPERTSREPSKQKTPPKSVAFADLPMLLRLRSPTMRFTIPNYRSKWQESLRNDAITSTDDETDTVSKSHDQETSDIRSISGSRSTSPVSTTSTAETESSSDTQSKKASQAAHIPLYQRQRIRALAAKVAPSLLRHDDSETSEGQVWPS